MFYIFIKNTNSQETIFNSPINFCNYFGVSFLNVSDFIYNNKMYKFSNYFFQKGPILFKQLRSGVNNEEFECYKFRSMTYSGDANSKQATVGDSRITKIGAFLRKTSLDEFPQFINVFLGDMSVVGPRPHMLLHTKEYSELVRKYMVRQLVKPGITGVAQVRGYRGETKELQDMEGRVRFDVWYIENWSLSLDINIIFQTIWNILKGDEKAY